MGEFEFKILENNGDYILFNVYSSGTILIDEAQKNVLENKTYNKLDDRTIKFLKNNKISELAVNKKNVLKEYILILHPSRKCNLNCKYCFGKDESLGNKEITIEEAKDYIEKFIMIYEDKASKITIDLSGSGEPLLKIDFIKELYETIKELRKKYKIEILVSFPTNGLLLDEGIKEYLSSTDILFGISLDGVKSTHDNLRLDNNGKETFEKILDNVKNIENKYLGIAVTLTGQHENICEDFYGLADLKIANSINIKPVRLNEDNPLSINKNNVQNIINSYAKLIDRLLLELKKNNDYYINLLIRGNDYLGKYISSVLKQSIKKRTCNAGITRFSVDSNGDLYGCQCGVGNDILKVGNINTGIDQSKVNKLKDIDIQSVNDCTVCWARYICGGECFINSIINNKNLGECVDTLCYFRKELIKLAIKFCNELKYKNKKQYYNLVYKVAKNSYYKIMDPAIFCIKYILEQNNLDCDINKLREQCKVYENGTDFENLKNTLNSYNISYEEIDLKNVLENQILTSKVIIKYKKLHGYFINYYSIILGVEHDGVILLDPIANGIIKKSKEECLDVLDTITIELK